MFIHKQIPQTVPVTRDGRIQDVDRDGVAFNDVELISPDAVSSVAADEVLENQLGQFVGGDTTEIVYTFDAKSAGDGLPIKIKKMAVTPSALPLPTDVSWTEENSQAVLDKLKEQNEIPVTSIDAGARTAVWNGQSFVVQSDSNPAVLDDFAGKVSGSTTENPHVMKSGSETDLMTPTDVNLSELPAYTNLAAQNSTYISKSTSRMGAIAQQVLSYDVVALFEAKYGTIPCDQDLASKIAWLKVNITSAKHTWYGYGTSGFGNQANMQILTSGVWAGLTTHVLGYSSSLTNTQTDLTNTLDDTGHIHYLLYSDICDGTTPSIIYTDYSSLALKLKAQSGYDVLTSTTPRRDAGETTALLLEKQFAQLTKDYTSKVTGSTTANPNIAYVPRNPSALMLPSNTQDKELTNDATNTPITSTTVDQQVTSLGSTAPNQMMDVSLLGRTAVNMVTNGDFSRGTLCGWSPSSSTNFVVDSSGRGSFLPITIYGGIDSSHNIKTSVGDKFYITANIKTTCPSAAVYFINFNGDGLNVLAFNATNDGILRRYSVLLSCTTSNNGNGYLKPQSVASSGFTNISVDNVMCINLTALYGSGNEPDLATCDKLFAGYFDGAKSIGGDTITATNKIANGNFSLDSNSDGLADNFSTYMVASKSISRNVQSFTASGTNGAVYLSFGDADASHKYYTSVWIKASSSLIKLSFADSGQNKFHSGSSSFERLSNIVTGATSGSWCQVADGRTGSWTEVQVKKFMNIDLTALFGSGNEPDITWCDRMFKNYVEGTGVFGEKIYTAKNLVTNGDFSNGTTGWSAYASTIAAANNTLSNAGDGSVSIPWSIATSLSNLAANSKIYLKVKFRVTNSAATDIMLFSSIPVLVYPIIQQTPVVNQWYEKSVVHTCVAGGTMNLFFRHGYADAATALNKVMEVQNVFAIDLTELFGAGNEPSTAQCDVIFKDWFDSESNVTVGPAVRVCGKNLLNPNKWFSYGSNSKVVNSTYPVVIYVYNASRNDYVGYNFYGKPDTTYFVKFTTSNTLQINLRMSEVTNVTMDATVYKIVGNDGTVYWGYIGGTCTVRFTVGSTGYCVFYFMHTAAGTDTKTLTDFQIEEGSSATTYEDYKETVIALPQTLKAIEY